LCALLQLFRTFFKQGHLERLSCDEPPMKPSPAAPRRRDFPARPRHSGFIRRAANAGQGSSRAGYYRSAEHQQQPRLPLLGQVTVERNGEPGHESVVTGSRDQRSRQVHKRRAFCLEKHRLVSPGVLTTVLAAAIPAATISISPPRHDRERIITPPSG